MSRGAIARGGTGCVGTVQGRAQKHCEVLWTDVEVCAGPPPWTQLLCVSGIVGERGRSWSWWEVAGRNWWGTKLARSITTAKRRPSVDLDPTCTRGMMALGGRDLPKFGKKRVAPILGLVVGAALVTLAYHVLTDTEKVYGLMIDAGSTGSRMHTFVFSKGDSGDLKLIKEDFFPIKPGLSGYKNDPSAAGKSLLPLLERSKQIVPKSARKTTPVFLRATAGLRMLGGELSEQILDDARKTLFDSGFRFDSKEWASVLGGNDEGIYTWITINYLLGRSADETAGTMEMGGGSAQIAFVPPANSTNGCSIASEAVEYKGKSMSLYTVSHLGFGLKRAKLDVMRAIAGNTGMENNPCLSNGKNSVELPFEDPPKVLEMTGKGDFASCSQVIADAVMEGAGKCDCGVCTYRKRAQPSATEDYFALAFYAERTVDLGLKNPVTMKDIRTLGESLCAMDVEDVKQKHPVVANGEAADLCFDLAFIYQHLRLGHGIEEATAPEQREPAITMAKQINGVELGWSLGAMFAELSKLGR